MSDFVIVTVEEVPIPYFTVYNPFTLPPGGNGYLAGEFPDGATTLEGAPTGATVRILYRPAGGAPGDGVVVATTQSAPDGTWRVDGLDPLLKYDVVGRKNGYNDVIKANVSPVPGDSMSLVDGLELEEGG